MRVNISPANLDRLADLVLRDLRRSGQKVSIHLVPPTEMRRLAARFFSDPAQHLNVLSFPAPQGAFALPRVGSQIFLGEIYLNRALAKGALGPAEILRLLIHGILHLVGYHHKGTRDTIRMEALETKLIAQLK